MTQKDKELLLKDLCARLPYGVKCHYDVVVPIIGKVKAYDKLRAISEFDSKPCFQFGSNRDIFDFDNIKPYLFPLSSMTEEQKQEFLSVAGYERREEDCGRHTETYYYDMVGHENTLYPNCDAIDWLNAHHFDYRGLIEKGLAIDATEMNVY